MQSTTLDFPKFDKPEWLKGEKHCIACHESLIERKILDICKIGLVCQNGHRFIDTLYEPARYDSATIKNILPPTTTNISQIDKIKYWLTNWAARRLLNSQLADILRRIVEIKQDNLHINDETQFRFCLLDGEPLVDFKQPDIWLQGLRCGQGHRWFQRSHLITSEDNHIALQADLSDENLAFLVNNWLMKKDDKTLSGNLHPQIIELLTWYEMTSTPANTGSS